MANRYLDQFVYSFVKKPVMLTGSISLSAAGAVTSFDIPGVATVVKTGTGAYTITLRDKYPSVKKFQVSLAETNQNLSARAFAADSSAKTFLFQTQSTGTATDATATARVWIEIVLSNSSVKSKG